MSRKGKKNQQAPELRQVPGVQQPRPLQGSQPQQIPAPTIGPPGAFYLKAGSKVNPLSDAPSSAAMSTSAPALVEVSKVSAIERMNALTAVQRFDRGNSPIVQMSMAAFHDPRILWQEAYLYCLSKQGEDVQSATTFAYQLLQEQNRVVMAIPVPVRNEYRNFLWDQATRYLPPYKEQNMSHYPMNGTVPPVAPMRPQRVVREGAAVSGLGARPEQVANAFVNSPSRPQPSYQDPQSAAHRDEIRSYASVDGNTYHILFQRDGVVVPGYLNNVMLHTMTEIAKGGDGGNVLAAVNLRLLDAMGTVVWSQEQRTTSLPEPEIPEGANFT
jgi:hypothetical protein